MSFPFGMHAATLLKVFIMLGKQAVLNSTTAGLQQGIVTHYNDTFKYI